MDLHAKEVEIKNPSEKQLLLTLTVFCRCLFCVFLNQRIMRISIFIPIVRFLIVNGKQKNKQKKTELFSYL